MFNLLFLSHALEWFSILFYVKEFSRIGITLHTLICFRIPNLTTIPNCSPSKILTCIFCHIFTKQ